jgi:predicted unusual protein kinase regulating ubiquinone biosynthesis (AarF/ABC1/UbiB family)
MPPSVSELLHVLPEMDDAAAETAELMPGTMMRPVPVGRWRRLRLLGTLQAKIGAAYLFYWLRGWFQSADQREQMLAATHWQTALRLLDSMGYLRGAVMKVGQTLANFPDIAPRAFVETLDQLHFDAPPLHWSLLREMVHNELGDDPKNLFLSFDKRAFAAASLGQVHRAQLLSGEDVAVKIQYPGIARSVREEFRNFFLFLLPGRLNKDWQNTEEQFDDLRARIERETNYAAEAAVQEKVRSLFHEDDGIVVPRVYPQHSTSRILTMDFLKGVHIDQFLERGPSQEERNQIAEKIVRAWARMLYAGRLSYADMHPGNFLVLDDGRLGVLDFGFVIDHTNEEWRLIELVDRAMTTGRHEDRIAAVKEWNFIRDDPADADRLRLCEQFTDWCWLANRSAEPFDFGDEGYLRHGIDLFTEMIRKRYNRSRPSTPAVARLNFGVRCLLYRLKAKIHVQPIAEDEVKATGWDRSDYA